MKKYIIMIAILLFAITVYAFQPAEWMSRTTTQTNDAFATAVAGYFYGIILDTSGTTATTTMRVCDASSTVTGNVLLPPIVYGSGNSTENIEIWFPYPLAYNSGVSVSFTGTQKNTSYMIFYRDR